MRSPPMRSPHEPLPARTSTPAILRAFAGPFCMTRTTEDAFTASPTIFAAWARGKGPGRPQRATSASPVDSDARIPTRSISKPREFAKYPSAPAIALTSLARFFERRAQRSTLTTSSPPAACMPSMRRPPRWTAASSTLLR